MTSSSPQYPTPLTTTIQNPRLKLLNGLKAGSYPLMTFMALPSVRTAQIVALTRLDGKSDSTSYIRGALSLIPGPGIIVDAEHGALGDESVHNAVAAISGLGVSPIVRVRSPAHDIIKRALDTGAHGIMVPQINNAEQAKVVVASSRFPPQGIRGQGSTVQPLAMASQRQDT